MTPLGILAQSGAGADSPPEGVSEWVLDFLGEAYTKNGSSVAVATVIDQPAKVDATEGLEILEDDEDTGVIVILGDLLADILTMDWTIVIAYKNVDTDFATAPLWINEPVDLHSFSVENNFTLGKIRVTDSGFTLRRVDITATVGVGVHKVAITRKEDFLSVSFDGGAVTTLGTDFNIPAQMNQPTQAGFGGPVDDFSYNNCWIRRFDLMEAVDDADLPGLSA